MAKKNDPRRKRVYFGFAGTSEFLEKSWGEFTSYCIGEIITSIGMGDNFSDIVRYALSKSAAWALYQEDKK